MRTLIVAPSWIGDSVLAQPLLHRLNQKYPDSPIDVLAAPWTAALWQRMDVVADVIESPFAHGELKLRDRYRLGRKLRSRGYDRAVVLPNSLKSALIPFFANIPLRVGYTGEMRYGLLNVIHKLDKTRLPLMADRYAALAEMPGVGPMHPLAALGLTVNATDVDAALAKLGLDSGESGNGQPVAALCPGAEYGPAKRWPPRHMAALAQQLAGRGYRIWLFGSNKDHAIAEEINALAGGICVNLCGRTNLGDAIDLLSRAALVVSNDSGLMHIAAALGRPLIALYGSSSPEHTPPMSTQAAIVKIDIECSPCFQRECPLGHFRCMNDLTPDMVLRRADTLQLPR